MIMTVHRPIPVELKKSNTTVDDKEQRRTKKKETQVEARTKKEISFAIRVKVRRTIPLKEYTTKEVSACWNSPEDIQQSRHEIHEEIAAIQHGAIGMQRGLEGQTFAGRKWRKAVGLKAVLAVMDVQKYQGFLGYRDPNAIARVYAETSIESRKDARTLGKLDVKASQYSFKQDYVDPMTELRARTFRTALAARC